MTFTDTLFWKKNILECAWAQSLFKLASNIWYTWLLRYKLFVTTKTCFKTSNFFYICRVLVWNKLRSPTRTLFRHPFSNTHNKCPKWKTYTKAFYIEGWVYISLLLNQLNWTAYCKMTPIALMYLLNFYELYKLKSLV